MHSNDICPITLDDLSQKKVEQVFVHRDVGMDIHALYKYLLQSPYFTNPVNRIPFEKEELLHLEERIRALHGPDAIQDDDEDSNVLAAAPLVHLPSPTHAPPPDNDHDRFPSTLSPIPGSPEATPPEAESPPTPGPWTIPDHFWFNQSTLAPRMLMAIETSNLTGGSGGHHPTPTVRLRVDLDMNLVPFDLTFASDSDETQSQSSTSSFSAPVHTTMDSSTHSSTTDEDAGVDAIPSRSSSATDLPNLPLPSLVKLFEDAGRPQRLKEELNMLQFLVNDAAELMKHMLEISTDNAFHEYVWTQTSSSILDAVTRFLRESMNQQEDQCIVEEFHVLCDTGNLLPDPRSPSTAPATATPPGLSTEELINNYNLEVVYNDCWEIYRIMVMHVLEGRYIDVCRDVLQISRNELRVMIDSHSTLIRQEEQAQDVPLTLIRDIVSSTSRMLDPERGPLTSITFTPTTPLPATGAGAGAGAGADTGTGTGGHTNFVSIFSSSRRQRQQGPS